MDDTERNPEKSTRSGRVAVGHPVDVASGEFFGDHTDFELDGIVPLTLGRRYSTGFLEQPITQPAALDPYEPSPFGPGWRANWDWRLSASLRGFAVVDGEGTRASFRESRDPSRNFAKSGRLLAPAHGMELVRVDPSRIRLVRYGTRRNPISHVFVWSQDLSRFFLERIERTGYARIDLRYDPQGRLIGLFQTAGQRLLRLDWDRERVARAVLVLPDGSERVAARYVYDRGVLIEVQDARGVTERYRYDAEMRMTQIVYRSGAEHRVTYDGKGRCVHVTGADRYEERHLAYDENRRTTYITDSKGAVTKCDYNEAGQVLREVSALGNERWHEFDDEGRPTVTYAATGRKDTTVYDEAGRTHRIILSDGGTRTLTHDREHRVTSFTDESGARTQFEYDADHNVVRVILPNGAEWHYRWTIFGERAGIRNPLGHEKYYVYDDFRNLETESDWQGNLWRSTFNALGQCLTRTDPLGYTTRYAYGATDQLFRVVDPDGRTWERHTDLEGRTTTFVRPDGRKSSLFYSSCGLLTDAIDEEGRRTRYHWDTEPGRLLAVTDPSGNVYRFDYDADGNVTRKRTFDGRTIIHRWNKGLLCETGAGGELVHWEYDLMDRPVTRRSPRDGRTEYRYDVAGRVVRIEEGKVVTEFKYDIVGHCIEEIQDGIVVRRQYDATGNPTALRAPGFDDETRYAFDPNGRCVALERACSSLPVEVSADGVLRMKFARDALGREVRRKLPGAGVFEQGYDPCGRLLAQAHVPGSSGPKTDIRREIQYDVSGALSVIRDSLRGQETFFHDATDTLVGVLHADGSDEAYTYDPSVNRVRRSSGFRGNQFRSSVGNRPGIAGPSPGEAKVEETIFERNRVKRITSYERAIEYEYDDAGRTISKTVRARESAAATMRFAWNSKGQMVSATLPNGDVWRYRYDGIGRRIAKIRPDGVESRFVWDGYRIVYHVEGSNRPTTLSYLPGDICPIFKDDGTAQYLLPDRNGAPSEVLGVDGKIRREVRKGTWGEGFDGGPVMQPAYGRWFDEETGLHYNVYRYYDPDTARFLSPDPIGLLGGTNEYAGVPSPVMWRDPLGLATKPTGPLCGPTGGDAEKEGTVEHAANFDEARALAFKRAGLSEADVTFTKVDPATGTVVEFHGPGGAKVAYDSPHASPGPGHDMPHVGWQTAGKRGREGAARGNITYDGPQHPFRSPDKGAGDITE